MMDTRPQTVAFDREVVDFHALESALRNLSVRQRETVVRRYFLDQSVDQIAAEMGNAPGTVKSTLHAAIGRMRAYEEET